MAGCKARITMGKGMAEESSSGHGGQAAEREEGAGEADTSLKVMLQETHL